MNLHLGDNVPLVKRRNRALILELILRQGPIPRVTISDITGLSRAAVSTITGELMDAGIIIETGNSPDGKRSVGRAPVFLDINGNLCGVLAVEMHIRGLNSAFVNLKSGLEQEIELDMIDTSDHVAMMEVVNGVIEQQLADARAAGRRVIGLGVSVSGLVDPFTGILHSSTTLGWRNVNIIKALRAHGDLPLVIDRNVRGMVLAEHLFGVGRGVSNMALIHMGTGIGCGIILNGELYIGSSNRVGEIGHTTINAAGDITCSCGNTGCLETVASSKAIRNWVISQIKAGRPTIIPELVKGDLRYINARVVAQAAAAGDALADEILNQVCRYLGLAIASLVNWYDPRLVVLAGHIIDAGDKYIDSIRGVATSSTLSGSTPPQIAITRFGRNVGVVGAGALALRELVYSSRFELPGDNRNGYGDEQEQQERLVRLTINRVANRLADYNASRPLDVVAPALIKAAYAYRTIRV